MGLEAATYVNQLVATNPTSSDPKSQGDDHLRLLKSVLQATFPNFNFAITITPAEANTLAGASSTGATIRVVTQPSTDNSTLAASTAQVQAAILASSGISAVLPAQSGNVGFSLITNGTSASWGVSAVDALGIISFLNT